ncbi:hypothetical protein BT93_K1842 [Corymbia citriodora subsp. variegata]|nr:hypothetical protein BT93_K1842 [Corymbia citriodora subsp. variegata]
MGNTTKAFFAAVLWQIWKNRNAAIFQDRRPDLDRTLHHAHTLIDLYKHWNQQQKNRIKQNQDAGQSWPPLKHTELKLNVDCAWNKDKLTGSVAGICRNEVGQLVDGFAELIHAPSVQIGETLAVRKGLQWLEENEEQLKSRTEEFSSPSRTPRELKVSLTTDNLSTVNGIMGRAAPSWTAQTIIEDCQALMNTLPWVTLQHSPREANKAADWAAKAHRNGTLPETWISQPPHSFLAILCMDFPLCTNSFTST